MEILGLILTITGIIIALLIPPIYNWNFFLILKYRRQLRKLKKELTESSDTFSIGSYRINNIINLDIFCSKETSLSFEDVFTNYSNQEKSIPKELIDLQNNYLKNEIDQAKKNNTVFDNNLSYSLNSLNIERIHDDRNRRHRITLNFTPTDFYRFASINLALDKKILTTSDGAYMSIREKYNLYIPDVSKLNSIPIDLKFGCGGIIRTKDNQIIFSIRSGFQYIVKSNDEKSDSLHLSIAEGMLRPVDEKYESPNPFNTIQRGLLDEMNINPSDYSINDIKLIGLCFDTLRFQPFGIFNIHLRGLTFSEIKQRFKLAKDNHENKDIIGVPLDISEIKKRNYKLIG